MVGVKLVSLLALAAGVAVLLEIFLGLSRFPLDIIGGAVAVVAGLLGLSRGD